MQDKTGSYCVARGDTCVSAMCRGRHRIEKRVGEVQARGGAGRGGVVTYIAGRIGTIVQMFLLSPEKFSVCVSIYVVTFFTAVLSNCMCV